MSSYLYRKHWRAMHVASVRQEKLRYYRQFQENNRRKLQRWTKEELKLITSRKRPSDRTLSESLGRSVQAIQQKRSELRKSSPKTRRLAKSL